MIVPWMVREDIHRHRFGQYFVGPLERVDAVDQVDVEVRDVDKPLGHPQEPAVALLIGIGCEVDGWAFQDAIGNDRVTHFLDLVRRQVGVLTRDHFRNEDLIDNLWGVLLRVHRRPEYRIVL